MLIFLIASTTAKGNRHQINKNDISNLFNQEVEDRQGLDKFLENSKKEAEQGVASKKAVQILEMNEPELEDKAFELNSINANSLESKGEEERAKEENTYYESLEIDYTDPKILNHKKDIDKIADANTRLLSRLIEGLRDFGIDCKTVKGDKELEPEYHLEIKKEPLKDVTYNQNICEEVRNRYSCTDTLTMKCTDLGFIAGTLKNVTGNMVHKLYGNGVLHIGVNEKAYFYNKWGAQSDFIFTFDIDNAAGIESFKLLQVDWADYVLIKLNGNIIFQSSGVNGKIEMSYDWSNYRVAGGKKYYGVDIGTGNYVPANTRKYYSNSVDKEGRQYLKNGSNTLHIRLAYGRGGKIWTALSYKERVCKAWGEDWNEVCKMQ